MNEGRDVAAQIQQGVQFDGRLGGTKQCSWKDRQAQVDGRGIECVNRIVEIEA